MYNIQLTIKNKTEEISFKSFRKAHEFYNELVSKYAPNAMRQTACWDIDNKPDNAIRLMSGRFVEEYIAF